VKAPQMEESASRNTEERERDRDAKRNRTRSEEARYMPTNQKRPYLRGDLCVGGMPVKRQRFLGAGKSVRD